MPSAIDPTVIGAGNVDKASVRLQFERARDEITAAQSDIIALEAAVLPPTINTFTAATDVVVNFPLAYSLFKLTVWDISSTVANPLLMRCLTVGTPDTGASDYAMNWLSIGPTVGATIQPSSAIFLSPAVSNTYTGSRLQAFITAGTVNNPFTVDGDFSGLTGLGLVSMQKTNGRRATNGAKSGIQFFINGGTAFSGKYILEPIA